MIQRFMVWLFTRFTTFDPDLLEWACRQEEAAKHSTATMRKTGNWQVDRYRGTADPEKGSGHG